jgi:fermentation-respiration switch protein FrsA (DUF1100 family)
MAGGVVTLILAVGLLNAWMYLQQPSMIFFPDRRLLATPADWGMDYEDVSFRSGDGVRLHGWYVPGRAAKRVLLFFHGNAGNISHRGESIAIFHRLGLDVFIFDYRGYGHSEGTPDESGLYRDAAAAWRYLTGNRGFAGHDVILFGRSLGGAVAANLASEVDAGALILESTLSRARDFARSVFPVLSRLVLVRYNFDTLASIRQVGCPVLVVHSRDDEIMPFRLGEKLYRAAGEPKVFLEISGDHNSGFLRSQPAYENAMDNFLQTLP